MSILPLLASSLNRKDEVPNQELARKISKDSQMEAIQELFVLLNGKNRNLQQDAIKVIYEIGSLKPKLLVGYENELLSLLISKNNRLQWGAMTALNTLTPLLPDFIYQALPPIILAADQGSVITKDQCVNILIQLYALPEYASTAFPLLVERLLKSPVNQLPMYAENIYPFVKNDDKPLLVRTLQVRLPDIEKDSKRVRIEKVIKRLLK